GARTPRRLQPEPGLPGPVLLPRPPPRSPRDRDGGVDSRGPADLPGRAWWWLRVRALGRRRPGLRRRHEGPQARAGRGRAAPLTPGSLKYEKATRWTLSSERPAATFRPTPSP